MSHRQDLLKGGYIRDSACKGVLGVIKRNKTIAPITHIQPYIYICIAVSISCSIFFSMLILHYCCIYIYTYI